jgi:hypothetical protein
VFFSRDLHISAKNMDLNSNTDLLLLKENIDNKKYDTILIKSNYIYENRFCKKWEQYNLE